MRKNFYIAIFLVFGWLFSCLPVFANEGRGQVIWTKKPGARTGLYTTPNRFVAKGVGFSVNALYYFGDVDNEGMAFHGGFNVNNLSLGCGLSMAYQIPMSNHVNMRFALCGGYLHGNNEEMFKALPEPRDDYRSFKSIFIQPVVGVQYYPFSNAGFYLYGGVAFTFSFITNYKFYYNYRVEGSSEKLRDFVEGSTYGILPMVQGGFGYSWRLTDNWSLSAEFLIEYGILDTHYVNLDAYPMAPTQNASELTKGSTTGKWIGKGGQLFDRWNDGWFQLGITVSYQWRTCEHCSIINNYHHIRGRRH